MHLLRIGSIFTQTRRFMRYFTLVILGLFTIQFSFARTLYVDPLNGNSAYDGLSPTFTGGSNGPVQKPTDAFGLYQSGDTILLLNGIYTGSSGAVMQIRNALDGVTIIGESKDSVIIDASGIQSGIAISPNTVNPVMNVSIENMTIRDANGGSSPSHLLIWDAQHVSIKNLDIIGSGQFNAPGASAVGVKVMECDTVSLEDVFVSFCEGNGFEFGGGTQHISMHNIEVLASSSSLADAAMYFRTSSAGIYPSGSLSVDSWTGILDIDSCHTGILFESQAGTITLDFTGTSNIEDNILLDGANFGASLQSTATLKRFGFNYLGTLGLLPGAETYFVNRNSLLSLTTNPTYVSASVGANITRTQFYIAGDMVPNLASNQTTAGDTLVFVDQDFSDDDLAINKSLFLMAENNLVTLNSFTINGAGAQADLINNFFIEEDLSLTNGFLNSDNFNRMTLLPGCLVIGGSSASFVTGTLYAQLASSGTSVLKFPSGINGNYRPVSLSIDQGSSDTITYGFEMTSVAPGVTSLPSSIDRLFTDHFWKFSSSNPANLNTVTATVDYDNPDGVYDPTQLRMIFLGDAATSWSDIGGIGSASVTGQITGNPVTEEGTFALANATGGNNFTGISTPVEEIGVKIFPNPASDAIQILIPENIGNTSLTLVDLNGRICKVLPSLKAGKQHFNVSEMPRGSYFLLFRGDTNGNAQIMLR